MGVARALASDWPSGRQAPPVGVASRSLRRRRSPHSHSCRRRDRARTRVPLAANFQKITTKTVFFRARSGVRVLSEFAASRLRAGAAASTTRSIARRQNSREKQGSGPLVRHGGRRGPSPRPGQGLRSRTQPFGEFLDCCVFF